MGPAPSSNPAVVAIIALEAEAEAVLAERAFSWRRIGEKAWDSERFPLRLAISGVGKVLASWCFARYANEASVVLSFGTSGGLAGEEIGSLWLVPEFVEHDMDLSGLGFEAGLTPWEGMEGPVMKTADRPLLEEARRAAAAAGFEAGECRSASGDSFISDSGRARTLAADTGARLVDMESAALAKLALLRAGSSDAAGKRRAPDFLALRYVSDNADHGAETSWKEETKRAAGKFAGFLLAFARSRAAESLS
jgi:adenosylhomocysteine nucleosidase